MNANYLKSFFWFFLFFTLEIKADFFVLDGKNRIDVIDEYIYKDSTKRLDIEHITKIDAGFVKSTSLTGFVTDVNANYWVRFKILNPSKQSLILYRTKDFKELKLYEAKNNQFVELSPFYDNSQIGTFFKKQHYVFNLPLSDSTAVYFAKITLSSEQFLGIYVDTVKNFYTSSTNEVFYYGCFFGLILLMMLYNLIHFLFNKELINLFYSFFLLGLMFYALGIWSILPFNQFSKKYMYFSYSFFHSLITVSLILYTYYFFDFKPKYFLLKKILFACFVLKFLLLFIQFFTPETYRFIYTPIYDIIMLGVCVWIGFYFYVKEKYSPAILFLFGFTVILFAFIYESRNDFEYVINLILINFCSYKVYFRSDAGSENILFFSGVIQLLFFTISMSNRYRHIKSLAIKAQKQVILELESKQQLIDQQNKLLEKTVEERTAQIRNQALEIARINKLLQIQNTSLKENVNIISKNRVLVKPINFDEFKAAYPTDESCYSFLVDLKWNLSFKCKKCENELYFELPKQFSRRCTKCNYIESATAHTIFHHLRFPIVKAFYIVFLVYTRKGITIDELSKMIDLRAGTCHTFKQKITEVMQNKKVSKRNSEGWSSYVLD